MTPNTEHEHQVALVAWFKHKYPDRIIAAIPNGGKRSPLVGMKLKAEGVLAGMPDLFITAPQNGYNGLFIEMKVKGKGKLSEAQKSLIPRLEADGYRVDVCFGVDEAKQVVLDYFNEAH